MKYLKTINESFQENVINKVVEFLERKLSLLLFPYHEEFTVTKGSVTYESKLFLTAFGKAIRFNFTGDGKLSSIDMWKKFNFNLDKADYTMELNTLSVINYLKDVLLFFTEPERLVEEFETEPFNVKQGEKEKAKTKSLMDLSPEEEKDINLDPFKAIELFTMQVAGKVSNAFVITGLAGMGKSETVFTTLDNMHVKYFKVSGSITFAGLYETLFLHRNQLLVFDDCDSVFEPPEEDNKINTLKAALDTKPKRTLSRIAKTYFNSEGMEDAEIEVKFKKTGIIPNQFDFVGQIIFISNKKETDLDPIIISRSLHIDINLTKEEIIERMKGIMRNLLPRVPYETKEEALTYLIHFTETYKTKFPLDLRSLIHSINLRISNDFLIDVGGNKYPAWQVLLKKYLIK